jgi:hypothetical protein
VARLALPAWARPGHPIVRYERRHWEKSRGWRLARVLFWGGPLTFVLLPAACAVVFSLGATFTSPAEIILTLGGTFTVGLGLLATLAFWLNNLSASLLAATLIARERESQTWPFLRLTSLTTLDIVGGKLAAVFYTLARPLQFLTALRLAVLLSGAVTLALAYAASGLTRDQLAAGIAGLIVEAQLPPGQWALLLVFLAAAGLFGLANWLAEPLLGVTYNAIVGLAASCLARSRGAAIVIVVAAHLGLGLALYAPAQQAAVFVMVPIMQVPALVNSLAVVLLSFGLQLALTAGLHLAVVAGCLAFSLRQAETLSE